MSIQTQKAFDCIAMKRDIQHRLLDEYEATGDRYKSYWHFMRETNRRNPGLRDLRRKLGFDDPSQGG